MKQICYLIVLTTSFCYGQTNVFPSSGNVGIGTTSPSAKINFNNLNDGTNLPDGISWYNVSPLDYGIFRTPGAWTAPNYQQLKINFGTGIVLNPGSDYGKSYVEIQGGGLRITSGKLVVANKISSGNAHLESPLYPGNNYVRTNFGSNVYWDQVAVRWQVDPIGNNDFSSIVHPNSDGLAFITAPTTANAPRTLTHGEFMAFERMRITATGNVGIGTAYPDTKLTVMGVIHTNEVRVDIASPIQPPDYVFDSDYNLLSLSEVEKYISENKHLPEVPSAQNMFEDGLNLKEMNLILLKKVEELTLHLIEQNKINQEQREQIEFLKNRVEVLEAE